MNIYPIKTIENIIHLDIGKRGIHSLIHDNLYIRIEDNLLNLSQRIIEKSGATIGVATGFFVPHGKPPAPETDGPIGALALARGLNLLGYKVLIITDSFCVKPLKAGIDLLGQQAKDIEIIEFPFEADELNNRNRQTNESQFNKNSNDFVKQFYQEYSSLKFLISIERVGPCHTLNSFLKQHPHRASLILSEFKKNGPGKLENHSLNMKGEPITAYTAKLHLLFEYIYNNKLPVTTIGIGDGGNEIGMGSIPWEIIHKNITNGLGGKVACRIPTNFTIVTGVSNWAGHALTAAIYFLLRKQSMFFNIFSEEYETEFMQHLTKKKLAIDGVLGYPNMSVDGIDWEIHMAILKLIRNAVKV